MRTRFALFLDYLRSSFWGIPGAAVVMAVTAAFCLVEIDHAHAKWVLELAPWLKDISPEGTGSLLGTVATSMLTLAGVTFSGTLVALTLASSQFGPRLLRNFTRASMTQVTLGVLLATYAYSLIVMRNVRLGDQAFVPHMATLAAFVLTLLSLVLFILFIHYVVTSIQAESVVADVHSELEQSINRFFGEENVGDDGEDEERAIEKERWDDIERETCLSSKSAGYLQGIDLDGLVAVAKEHDLRLRVLPKPGQYVVVGQPLAAWKGRGLPEAGHRRFLACFLLGAKRTAEQDFEYCIRQLVEVALRALSPGINDPFTAMNCIDHLGGALVSVARKRLPRHQHVDSEGTARVQTPPATYEGFLGSAFDQVRQASAGKPDVIMRLLETLYQIGQQCRTEAQLKAVQTQADLTIENTKGQPMTSNDVDGIDARHEKVKNLSVK